MHFLGNEGILCRPGVEVWYGRVRASCRDVIQSTCCAAGERMPCLSAAHCVALKSWRGGRSLEQSRVSSMWVEFCFRHHCSLKRTWLRMSTLSGLAAQSVRASASGVCGMERHRFQLKYIRRFLSLDTMYCVYPVVSRFKVTQSITICKWPTPKRVLGSGSINIPWFRFIVTQFNDL